MFIKLALFENFKLFLFWNLKPFFNKNISNCEAEIAFSLTTEKNFFPKIIFAQMPIPTN